MGNDGKQPGLSSTGILWLVLLGAGALFLREVPWQGSRPAGTEVKRYSKAAYQDVDARLWQDPMGAVAQAREEMRKRQASDLKSIVEAAQPNHPASDLLCAPNDPRRKNKEVLVLGAMVSGAPYPERTEFRRRARYAILAGLNQTGFVPEDEEHLGYFLPQQAAVRKPSEKPLPEFIAYEWMVPTESNLPGHVAPSASSAGGNVPRAQNILLLWLDEDLFGDDPKTKMERVAASLMQGADGNACDLADERIQFAVLGPSATWPLQNMIAAKADQDDRATKSKPPITFYAYGATADEAGLLAGAEVQENKPLPTSVHQLFKRRNTLLFRTIGSDDSLANDLADELGRRNVRPNQTCDGKNPARCQHVVLIAERDSFYGRSLPWTMAGKLAKNSGSGARDYPSWIHAYSYLRGLDGQLPALQVASDGGGNKKDDGDAKPNAPSANPDAKRIERPDGQGQFDYLRRLSDQLVTVDEDLRTHREGSISAIGVLGSDVYDKLLILQALRAQFPAAIIFTTDIEAIYLHPQQLEWTRNVIVASSYGLQLDPDLQRGIPPFRDSYQTALFLSTMIAVRHVRVRRQNDDASCLGVEAADERKCWGIPQDQIQTWLSPPRVFEIGRSAAFEFRQKPELRGPIQPCTPQELGNCAGVHPLPSAMYPEPSSRTIRVAFLLVVGAVILAGLVSGAWGRVGAWLCDSGPAIAPTRRRIIAIAAAVGFAAFVALAFVYVGPIWHGLANRLTEGSAGEPFVLTGGVSIWPTVIVRVVAIVLSVLFICRGWSALNTNLDDISQTLMCQRPRYALMRRLDRKERRWPRWLRFVRIFSYRLKEGNASGPAISPSTGLGPSATRLWLKYMYQDRWRARFCRILGATSAYYVFGIFVITAMGSSSAPYRGDLAIWIEPRIRYVSVFVMLFLIFFVVDATVFCYQLVSVLRKALPETADDGLEVTTGEPREARWPAQTLEKFAAELGLDKRYLDDWVTMHFVGRRTKVVSRLVYYPFIVISLMIVSRSSLFDNWSTSAGLAIVITASVVIVVTCGVLLRLAAERLRRRAVWRLTNAKIPLQSRDEDGQRWAEKIHLMIDQIRAFDTGAFAPYSQQPLVKALLLPLTTYGGAALVEYLSIANF